MKNWEKLMALLLVIAQLILPIYAFNEIEIPAGWSHDALTFAVDNDILRGDQNKELHPTRQITRAELSAVLVRLLGATEQCSLDEFRDVAADAWYIPELSAAVAAGLIRGLPDGRLQPNSPINRQQAMVMLCRAYGITCHDRASYQHFSDSDSVSAYARDAVSALYEIGALSGYPDGTVHPLSYITREEIAQLIYRLTDAIIDDPTLLPTSGTVIYRGSEPLPQTLEFDGILILGQAMPATLAPKDWSISQALVLHTGKHTEADLTGVETPTLVVAPVSGQVAGGSPDVWLWGSEAEYTGSAAQLVCMDGTQTAFGAYDTVSVRGGALTINGSVKLLELDSGTTATLNGKGDTASLLGEDCVLGGSGHVRLLRIAGERHTVTISYDELEDLLYNAYRAEHDSALSVVKTMNVEVLVRVKCNLYSDKARTKYLCTAAAGTRAVLEWHPSGGMLITLPDGNTGWTSSSNVTILGSDSYTDGDLDYSTPIKEGFVDLRGYSSETSYLIWVSRYTQRVMVFQGSAGNWKLQTTYRCSTGKVTCPTPQGIWKLQRHSSRWNFSQYYVNNITIYNGDFAFHSIPMNYNGTVHDGTIGKPASAGCVRMLPEDAKAIAALPLGTCVVIY